MVEPSTTPPAFDSVAAIHARFNTRRLAELRATLSEELLASFDADPQGQHPEPLLRLLRFLSRRAPAERPTVYEQTRGTFRLVRPPAARGEPYRLIDTRVFDAEPAARSACLRRELFDVFGWGEDPAPHTVDGPPVPPDGPTLLGYADQLSVAPGDRLRFMVSAEDVAEYTTELVRLRHSDDSPNGPGVRVEPIASDWTGRHQGAPQPIRPGSHILVADGGGELSGASGFAAVAVIYPTARTGGRQAILAAWEPAGPRGYALGLDEAGRLTLWLGDGQAEHALSLAQPLELETWWSVGVSYDISAGAITLAARPLVNSANSRRSPIVVDDTPRRAELTTDAVMAIPRGDRLVFGALAPELDEGSGHYNGKIESPGIWPRPLPPDALAAAVADPEVADPPLRWWFGPALGERTAASLTVACAGRPELDGRLVNLPVRAVTGWRWTGAVEHYAADPAAYGAIHFHDDAVIDCGWRPTHSLTVPTDLPSGVYALRLADVAGRCQTSIPFTLRPPAGVATGDIALLLPTATYLAYANERGLGYVPVVQPGNAVLERRYDLGHSAYARHTDGSGVCYTSHLRPILTTEPYFRTHLSPASLMADLYIVDWLTAQGISFDVITDHDLHTHGAELLGRYRGVLTGAHPEYASTRMLDGIERYLDAGGNFGYLGGNGFYWVVSFHPELPHVMELRRGESGSRTWQARPGEYHHATTGERGGLWRMRGRAPQKIFGLGFSSQGGGAAGRYRLGPDPDLGEAAFAVEGVPEVFGDTAMTGGGAVGEEVDRYDTALGSPPEAVVLATSEGLGDGYQFVVDEVTGSHPGLGGTEHPDVRSDLVYFRTRGGGSVFATGSIAYVYGLSANNYDNGLSRLTRNVIDHWLAEAASAKEDKR